MMWERTAGIDNKRTVLISWLIVGLIIIGISAIRIRLLDVPLERDEGEYTYMGQLMLQGVPPFQAAWNFKLPGIYAAYALILAVFGQSTAAVHFGFLIVNAINMLWMFLLGRRLFGALAGFVACASYGVLAVSPGVLGTAGHATHFILLFSLPGILMLLRAARSGRAIDIFLGALLFGTGILMKQHGSLFAVFGACFLLSQRRLWSKLPLYALGVLLPWGFTCLALWYLGVFERFWFWTVTFARTRVSGALSAAASSFLESAWPVITPNLPLWLLSAAGIVLAYRDKNNRDGANVATALLLFSVLATGPGFFFRSHYFVMVLPAVALLAGAAVSLARPLLGRRAAVLMFGAVLIYSFASQRYFFFRMNPVQASRALYEFNPFPEAVEVAGYIRDHSSPDARIAILGSEPEIYFYSERRSASGYIYMYDLMEIHPYSLAMQQEFIKNIEEARPEYIVTVIVPTSWLRRKDSVSLIFDWWAQYGPRNYVSVGVADILAPDHTQFVWDAEAASYRARSPQHLSVFRKVEAQSTPLGNSIH